MDSIICKQHDPHCSFSLPAQNHQRGSSNFSELCLMETWKIVILPAKTNTDKRCGDAQNGSHWSPNCILVVVFLLAAPKLTMG
jgi:hypothetical protein